MAGVKNSAVTGTHADLLIVDEIIEDDCYARGTFLHRSNTRRKEIRLWDLYEFWHPCGNPDFVNLDTELVGFEIPEEGVDDGSV